MVLGGKERASRLVVGLLSGNRHELSLRVAQRGQLAAEDAAGIDVGRVVQPLGFRNGRVAVDDHRLAAVVGGPVQADRQPELVGLAGRVAVQRELADGPRAAALHLGLQPRMGDDELAVVEDVVADQAIQPRLERFDEGRSIVRRQRLDLGEALGQAVGDLDVSSLEGAEQLLLVVARDAPAGACVDHVADDAQGVEDARTAIDQIADEHRLAAVRVAIDGASVQSRCHLAAPTTTYPSSRQQRLQLIAAAVNVADDVERARERPSCCSTTARA